MYLCRRLDGSDASRHPRLARSSPSQKNSLAGRGHSPARVQAAVTLARARPLRTPSEFSRTAAMLHALTIARQKPLCESTLPWSALVCTALLTARVNAQQTEVRR
jgi:hypothetical protein